MFKTLLRWLGIEPGLEETTVRRLARDEAQRAIREALDEVEVDLSRGARRHAEPRP